MIHVYLLVGNDIECNLLSFLSSNSLPSHFRMNIKYSTTIWYC